MARPYLPFQQYPLIARNNLLTVYHLHYINLPKRKHRLKQLPLPVKQRDELLTLNTDIRDAIMANFALTHISNNNIQLFIFDVGVKAIIKHFILNDTQLGIYRDVATAKARMQKIVEGERMSGAWSGAGVEREQARGYTYVCMYTYLPTCHVTEAGIWMRIK